MGSDLLYEIHQNAYIKLVLHSIKHKSSAVNGVLLGTTSASGGLVEIDDAIPLFHSQLGILPPLEIALFMIEEYCRGKASSIVGYFHANERIDDAELGSVPKNIADHIHQYFPQCALLLLDAKKLKALPKSKDRSPVMQLYTKDASRSWKLAGSNGNCQLTLKEPVANEVLLDYISSEKWKEIQDFDDHLDDISKDWLNKELFE
ncbi:unnamed protein product [Cuscuta campestris]|uniref:MPN domain-containing protein n=2 Tax=Cuscuta sect. Cleistogrammica TaxID=1824901 RepID=A0A484L590_9ASTE|nr:hypothetical protein DM860_009771 [Cuscuta australis]VFQ71503.1 unnamed protein product [Cuscuta campestris]